MGPQRDPPYRLGIAWYLVRINPATGEPLGPPTFWARDPRFSDTSGWSNRPSRDGGIIYVQGPAENNTTYLRVIPDWVSQMRAAVDAASRWTRPVDDGRLMNFGLDRARHRQGSS